MSLRSTNAFTLVEIAIVLVVLGLIVGGVVVGQDLMKAAELRSVINEYTLLRSATNSFKEKYNSLPGDMPNAASFWGAAAGNGSLGSACASASALDTRTCNGNGNSEIEEASDDGEFGEMFMFWQHLSNAGYISGTFSGKSGEDSDDEAVTGLNVMKSKFKDLGWSIKYIASSYSVDRNTLPFSGFGDANRLVLGRDSDQEPVFPGFTPSEASSLDEKIDDGKPAKGKLISGPATGNSCTNAVSTSDTAAAYNIQLDNMLCAIYFPTFF